MHSKSKMGLGNINCPSRGDTHPDAAPPRLNDPPPPLKKRGPINTMLFFLFLGGSAFFSLASGSLLAKGAGARPEDYVLLAAMIAATDMSFHLVPFIIGWYRGVRLFYVFSLSAPFLVAEILLLQNQDNLLYLLGGLLSAALCSAVRFWYVIKLKPHFAHPIGV